MKSILSQFVRKITFCKLCFSQFSFMWLTCSCRQILDRKVYRETCSGHGRYLLGRCRCDRLYHGTRCEFKEECLDDSDCGIQGTCIDNGGTTAPTKHCYCNAGWFGPGCGRSKFHRAHTNAKFLTGISRVPLARFWNTYTEPVFTDIETDRKKGLLRNIALMFF